MDQQTEKDKTERVTGLGRRTREEIEMWNQMTAFRFQTERRHQTSPASIRGEGGGGRTNKNSHKSIHTGKFRCKTIPKSEPQTQSKHEHKMGNLATGKKGYTPRFSN